MDRKGTGVRPRARARGRGAANASETETGRRGREPPPGLRVRGAGGVLATGLLLCSLLLLGCDGLGQPEREEARARVTADRDAAVEIVTSTSFNVISFNQGPGGRPQVELLASDTVEQEPPWEETFDISATRRFYIQVTAADTGSIVGTLEVFIDGERRANLTTDLQERPLTNLFLQQR